MIIILLSQNTKLHFDAILLFWCSFWQLYKHIYAIQMAWSHMSFMSNTSLAAKGALTHRLQRRTASKTQNGHRGPQNG